jgi:hypothetical protein
VTEAHPEGLPDLARVAPLGWRCQTVHWHRPAPHVRHLHHVWPLYLGGPEDGPLASICPSCHGDCHLLIDKARKHGWKLTTDMHHGYAHRVVELASLGILAVTSKALPVLPAWAEGSAA